MKDSFAFTEDPSTVDPSRPLIYLWRIVDRAGKLVVCYVGKAKNGASRPRRAYTNNVRRLRAGLPYHGQSKHGYRSIHHRLSQAVDAGHRVTLTLVCNVDGGEDINEVERRVRAQYGCPGS